MRRKRVLLDVDGPLTAGFLELACRLLRERGYQDAEPGRVTGWEVFRALGVDGGAEEAVRARLRGFGVARGFAPREGAIELVRGLRAWADVYAVTAPLDGAPTWPFDRERWLVEELGFAPSEVVHARDKRLVAGDVLVDDKPEHLVGWSAEHPEGLAVLWEAPYNDAHPWPGPRVSGYVDLEEVLRSRFADLIVAN